MNQKNYLFNQSPSALMQMIRSNRPSPFHADRFSNSDKSLQNNKNLRDSDHKYDFQHSRKFPITMSKESLNYKSPLKNSVTNLFTPESVNKFRLSNKLYSNINCNINMNINQNESSLLTPRTPSTPLMFNQRNQQASNQNKHTNFGQNQPYHFISSSLTPTEKDIHFDDNI